MLTFIKNGTVKRESEHLYKIFYFVWLPREVKKLKLFSEINALSETKVKWKLEINMLDKLLRKMASLKTSSSEKPVKQYLWKIAVLEWVY